MNRDLLASLCCSLFLAITWSATAQEAPRTAGHPFFQGMAGNWTEKGALIPAPEAQPIQGAARSTAKPILNGIWFQVEGIAEYGQVKWAYRWMYRVGETNGGVTSVYAHYIDTMGQFIRYSGQITEDGKRLSMTAPLSGGGEAAAQLTLQEDGTLLIQNVNSDASGNAMVRYQAESSRQAAAGAGGQ